MIRKALFFLLVFCATLIWRFPYEQAIRDQVARLESKTSVQLDYTPVRASIRGVEWKDVKVTSSGGVQASFVEAKLVPRWTGLSSNFRQDKGFGRLVLTRQRQVAVNMQNLEIQSGSKEVGLIRATGDLSHDLTARKGEGNLRLELPNFKGPLPILPELVINVGSKLFWQDKGQGYEMRVELTMVGGSDFHAEGTLSLEPQQGLPHRLNGNLQFRTPLRQGTLRLAGSWKQPEWTVVPKK